MVIFVLYDISMMVFRHTYLAARVPLEGNPLNSATVLFDSTV